MMTMVDLLVGYLFADGFSSGRRGQDNHIVGLLSDVPSLNAILA